MINILLIIIGASGIALYLISTIFIYDFHYRRNDKTPGFLAVNSHILKFVSKYKKITKSETRSVGPLFYLWIISVIIVSLSAVLLFLFNVVVMLL
ncbi:MAG: hypothetical protein DRP93_03230 [Candidatus Neomarinimicrobiota bacterium]|nr:MAG: hypothetical protein DRP93_03230 [Candidatus Neomarinimicrobiota bacterium]